MNPQNSEVRMSGARSVLSILLLLAGSLSPPALSAQGEAEACPPQAGRGFSIDQNYPTPVNPETWIPIVLEDCLFEQSDSVVVSLRIVNPLYQAVAIPDLEDGARRRPLVNMIFRRPGRAVAYWDGRDLAGVRVPTGIYYAELTVQGQNTVKKLVVENSARRRSILPRF